MSKQQPVYFDRSGTPITIMGVLTGVVLTLVCGVLLYHFWYVRPHTVPVNPQNRGISVGFELIPEDMEPYRGLVSYEAEYGPSTVWHPEFLFPPAVWPGGLHTELVYWTRDGVKKTRRSSFFIACDPDRVYYPIDQVREVILHQVDDRGLIFVLVAVQVRNTSPSTIPVLMPRIVTPQANPTLSPRPRWSRVPA
ncbi:MAG TPA: hypothetical protein VJ553_01185 [Candidatus Paceibacterota bacterium]|nr:hypothetical protein [Candidatus Paceibacterota bacterium]